METNCLQKMLDFILKNKAAFVSGALFYVQRYSGKLALHCALLMTSRWQVINLHIYAATNSVSGELNKQDFTVLMKTVLQLPITFIEATCDSHIFFCCFINIISLI